MIPQKDRHLAIASGDVQCAATTVETWIVWNAGGVATKQIFQMDKSYGADGMVVRSNINKVADLKGEMLTEATKRAREAAEKFANESGARVGAIQTANQGIVEINPAVEIPNDRPEKQINKKVRVVTTITYFLRD